MEILERSVFLRKRDIATISLDSSNEKVHSLVSYVKLFNSTLHRISQ